MRVRENAKKILLSMSFGLCRCSTARKQRSDLFPHTPAYDLFPCTADIQTIVSSHVETVVLLSQQKPDDYVEVELELDELESKKEIPTEFGETLSWEYLCYVRKHPIEWNIPTCILYSGKDNLTSRETISEFADKIGADLTVMEDGEHWFHTNAQMQFLDDWLRRSIP